MRTHADTILGVKAALQFQLAELLGVGVADPLGNVGEPGLASVFLEAKDEVFIRKGVEAAKDLAHNSDQRRGRVLADRDLAETIPRTDERGADGLVKKGQVLFEIDPRTFEAALEQTRGQLATQQARWDTAKANLKRIKPLAEQNAVSQKDLDDATGAEQAAHAAVIAAQASVDKAAVDLGFTKITSLIDGIAGIEKAQIGNLVGPGASEELTTVSTVNPIKVYVQISEQEYLKTMERTKNKTLPTSLELILADGGIYPHKGEIAFADRQVNVQTGTIKVATLFPNPNNLLRPGQFAKIRAVH